jgi:hypothetical protein
MMVRSIAFFSPVVLIVQRDPVTAKSPATARKNFLLDGTPDRFFAAKLPP